MHRGILVHEHQEGNGPDGAHHSEHIEDRRPAAIESVFRQQTGQWHRDNRSELRTRIDGSAHSRSLVRRNPFGQEGVSTGHNGTLAQTLDEAHSTQTPDATFAGSHRDEEGEHRVDQHAVAQEAQRSVLLGQNAEGNLGDHVAVEEGGQDIALQGRIPGELAILGIVLRGENRGNKLVSI